MAIIHFNKARNRIPRKRRETQKVRDAGPTRPLPPKAASPTPEMSSPRRLAVLCSHLRPDGPAPPAEETVEGAGGVSTSTCANGVGGDGAGDGDAADCVFCRIIRGHAPAYKVRCVTALFLVSVD